MIVTSRRHVLRNTGLAIASPLAGAFFAEKSFAQSPAVTSPPSPATRKFVPFSPDLADWVIGSIYTTYGKFADGTASAGDLTDASSKLHLLGHHIANTGFDYLLIFGATKLDVGNVNVSPADIAQKSKADYAILRKYNPSLTLDQVTPNYAFTPDVLAQHKQLLMYNGYSGFLHDRADELHHFARKMGPAPLVNTGLGTNRHANSAYRHEASFVSDGLYHYQKPHLVEVQSPGQLCKQIGCLTTSTKYGRMLIADKLASWITGIISNQLGLVGCEAEGAVELIGDLESFGLGLLATPIEIALCEATEQATTTLVNYIFSTAASNIIENIIDKLREKWCD